VSDADGDAVLVQMSLDNGPAIFLPGLASFQTPLMSVAVGPHNALFRAFDRELNVSERTVSFIRPDVPQSAPTVNSLVVEKTPQGVITRGTASDADGDLVKVSVFYDLNFPNISETPANGTTTWSAPPVVLPNGTHRVRAVATDVGNMTGGFPTNGGDVTFTVP
jgi:hypothetical protein